MKALELAPTFVEAYEQLGQLYSRSNRSDKALATVDKALAGSPKDPRLLMLRGVLCAEKNDVAKAEEAYTQVLEWNPRFVPAANNLAWLLSEHGGDAEKALALAQAAKEDAPDDPRVSDTLGWILYKRGVYQRALGFIKQGASKLPNDPEINYHLGMAHLKLEDRAAAKQELSKALALDGRFAEAEDARIALASIR